MSLLSAYELPLDTRELAKRVWVAMLQMEGVEPVGIGSKTQEISPFLAIVSIQFRYRGRGEYTHLVFSDHSETEALESFAKYLQYLPYLQRDYVA